MTSRRLPALAAFGLAGILTLGACGGGDDDDSSAATTAKATDTTAPAGDDKSDDKAAEVKVSAKEFVYTPAKITVKAGQATKVELKNTGAVEHDITIDEVTFKVAAAAAKTATGELKVDKAGTYTFYCSVPGHREAGMEGTLVVE